MEILRLLRRKPQMPMEELLAKVSGKNPVLEDYARREMGLARAAVACRNIPAGVERANTRWWRRRLERAIRGN